MIMFKVILTVCGIEACNEFETPMVADNVYQCDFIMHSLVVSLGNKGFISDYVCTLEGELT